jgi:Asp-tRNA(Asn)/Glu-tRNA(Gln) amidotransferase A subunit family amidase
MPAVEAIAKFNRKTLSPVDLMEAVIRQAEAVEPHINAFSFTFYDQAMEQARAAERRYHRNEPLGALDGIPIAVKEEASVKGQPVTEASLVFRDRVASEDAPWIARLRNEGAIFHARSNCPEFSSLWNTHSRLFGLTRNPWHLDVSPGGSSGGAAASLAAGSCTLATGSDIGGSIRQPSSQCGLVGFNPPYGRVPDDVAPFNLDTYCANGPMARTVADAAMMQNAMSGAHPSDAASTLPRVFLPTEYAGNLAGSRIAYTLDFGYRDVEPDVLANTLGVIDQLRSLGAIVEQAYIAHIDQIFGAAIAEMMGDQRDLLCDYNIHLAEIALARASDPFAYYRAAMAEESGLQPGQGPL